MKKLVAITCLFFLSALSSFVMAQDKGASTGGTTKMKAKPTIGKTGKDDNCYLNGNGGGTPTDSTKVPAPADVIKNKKVKDAGKSLINGAGFKIP